MTSITAKTKKAQELYQEYLQARTAKEGLVWWTISRTLYHLKKDNLYKFVFGEAGSRSFLAFCGEIDEPYSTVNYRVNVYKKFVVELKLKEKDLYGINSRKLDRAIQYVDKDNYEEILEAAKGLSFTDFLVWLKETF